MKKPTYIPLELSITIGKKQLAWPACMERGEFDSILKAPVERLGEPVYRRLEMGEIGTPKREITVEPVPEKVPEVEPEKVPA